MQLKHPTNPKANVPIRPALDKSDHLEARCPKCRCTAYLADKSGPVKAEAVVAGKPFAMVCRQPECGFSGTFTVEA